MKYYVYGMEYGRRRETNREMVREMFQGWARPNSTCYGTIFVSLHLRYCIQLDPVPTQGIYALVVNPIRHGNKRYLAREQPAKEGEWIADTFIPTAKRRNQSWGGGAVVARTIPMMLYLDRAVRGSTPCRLNLFPFLYSPLQWCSNPLLSDAWGGTSLMTSTRGYQKKVEGRSQIHTIPSFEVEFHQFCQARSNTGRGTHSHASVGSRHQLGRK
jgi:hypothetical protein